MTTAWTLPTNVIQYVESGGEESHIPWREIDSFSALKTLDARSIQTQGALQHIARSPKHDITNKTYYIRATGFRFSNLPATLSGIEARLTTQRYGRATDDTVELCLDGASVGENRATMPIAPIKVYGSATDVWNADSLTVDDIKNSTFGIVFRFRAHPHWPHRDPVMVDAVELRIH